jgi:FkbM family methyltransferase
MLLDRLKSRVARRLRGWQRHLSDNRKISYSQCGEDLILRHLLRVLDVDKVVYLDLGAHHPTYLSNTYLFYQEGGHGVCVEPDPSLSAELEAKRSRDVILNCGVGVKNDVADFFVMTTNTLSTFSRAEAERYQAYGNQRIVKTMQVELRTIDDILAHHFEQCPHLVSLDVEGLDYRILQSLDFSIYRPRVFCLETLTYTEDRAERKLDEIIELMLENGYLVYADTYINTIFVDSAAWENRLS